MTEEKPSKLLKQEHDEAHIQTLQALKETDIVLQDAQTVLTEARTKLRLATMKYEERLYGPENSKPH